MLILGISLQYPLKEYLNNINLINNKKHNSRSNFCEYYNIIGKFSNFDYKPFISYYKVNEKETNEKIKIVLVDKNYLYNEEAKLVFSKKLAEEKLKNQMNKLMLNIEIMKKIEGKNEENENVVKYYEYFENEKEFAIVMELCNYTLLDYLTKKEKPFNLEEIYNILSQLNNTFKIMSDLKITHSNIILYIYI